VPETRTRARTKGEPAAERPVREAPRAERDGPRPVCTVAFCPICLAVTAAQAAAPDAIDHLLSAARELFLAARVVIDARADDLGGNGSPTKLEKVEIA
jgi:hypothetical protein